MTMRFNFLNLLDRILLTSFPEAVRDNIASDDVTITSSLRSDVIILLGKNFLFFLSKMSPQDGSCHKLQNCVYNSTFVEVMKRNLWPLFSQTKSNRLILL